MNPDNQGLKYNGNVFKVYKLFKYICLFLYLLFLLTKKFSISFSNRQSLTNSNWHRFLAVNKGYLAKITKTLAKSLLLLAIHVTY